MKYLSIFLNLLLASCGTFRPVKDTSINHLLDPVVPARDLTAASPAIAVARPSLPSYLDRQELVSRNGEGQLQMNSYHVWAEPLPSGIARVLSQNLGRLTRSVNIQPVGNFVTMEYDRLLEVRVARFEPDPQGNIILECTWKIQPVAGPVATTRTFTTMVAGTPIAKGDSSLGGRTAAMNEALARLARSIARTL